MLLKNVFFYMFICYFLLLFVHVFSMARKYICSICWEQNISSKCYMCSEWFIGLERVILPKGSSIQNISYVLNGCSSIWKDSSDQNGSTNAFWKTGRHFNSHGEVAVMIILACYKTWTMSLIRALKTYLSLWAS